MEKVTQEQTPENDSVEKVSVSKPITEPNKMFRRFMITINNPEETDDEMEKYLQSLEHMKFYSFNREQAPTTGTIHFQMFLIFSSPKRFSTIKSYFPKAHIENCIKSSSTCLAYTTKSETRIAGPYEWGTFEDQGSRSDIKSLNELIKAGAPDKQIRELLPNSYTRYSNYISNERQKMLAEELNNKIKENFIVVYIYGKTETGKSTDIFTGFGNSAYYVSDYVKFPWDSYQNQDIVVMDDFYSQFNFDIMKRYIDIFPIDLSSRYNNKFGNYTKVFIISNDSLISQYSFERQNNISKWTGFKNRIHFVLHYENNKIYVEEAFKDIDELKKILPTNMLSKLDTCRLVYQSPKDKSILQKFEQVPIDDLPF